MAIHRDEQGCIMQHDVYDLTKPLDGGDSASRVGIMALCGSEQDRKIISLYEQVGLCMRHPTQEPWDNTGNFTRDQLVCLAAGMAKSSYHNASVRIYKSHKERGWRAQNVDKDYPGTRKTWPDGPDWLAPDVRLHLRLCAGQDSRYYFIGYLFLFVSLVYNTLIKPDAESNQFICQLVIAGPKWVKRYKRMHPNWRKPIVEYWSGWRDNGEIAGEIIKLLEREEYKV